MNFSQVIKEGEVALELKYCERCGGLWLRALRDDESYCAGCRAAMEAWPCGGRRKKNPNLRRTRGNGLTVHGQEEGEQFVIETLLGVAEAPTRQRQHVSGDVMAVTV